MAFEPGDEVVYEGSLGHHNGRVTAATEGGPVDVQLDGVGLVRTDEGSLTHLATATVGEPGSGTAVPLGQSGILDGPRGKATNIETGVVTAAGQPLPVAPAQPGSTPLDPTPGFAHDDLATLPEGNAVAAPSTDA
jgi:hypothetical protein